VAVLAGQGLRRARRPARADAGAGRVASGAPWPPRRTAARTVGKVDMDSGLGRTLGKYFDKPISGARNIAAHGLEGPEKLLFQV